MENQVKSYLKGQLIWSNKLKRNVLIQERDDAEEFYTFAELEFVLEGYDENGVRDFGIDEENDKYSQELIEILKVEDDDTN